MRSVNEKFVSEVMVVLVMEFIDGDQQLQAIAPVADCGCVPGGVMEAVVSELVQVSVDPQEQRRVEMVWEEFLRPPLQFGVFVVVTGFVARRGLRRGSDFSFSGGRPDGLSWSPF